MRRRPSGLDRHSRERRGCGESSDLISVVIAAGLLLVAAEGPAQTPPPPSPPGGVPITFLPPPLEGTLSTGIYTVDGKLVRTLNREATERDFTVGLNGFITQWDGKDNAGKIVAAGKYFVRGYAVGATDVQGVAFHGNDWLSEDENVPRIADLTGMEIDGAELLLLGRGIDAKDCVIHLPRKSGEVTFDPFDRAALAAGSGDVRFSSTAAKALAQKGTDQANSAPIAVPGRGGTKWSIESGRGQAAQRKVLQRSADGAEILRELEIEANEPQPVGIAAAPDADEIYLLERNASEVRVRGLRLKKVENTSDGKAVSEWELFLTKSIRIYSAFAQFAPALGRIPPPQAVEKVRVNLVPNELLSVAPAAVQIGIGMDEHGSFLQTLDGLLLRRVTDTPHLRWATLASERDGSISLFQSDGAAVEEYRLGKLDQMMAFDAGEYAWAPPK